MPTEMPEGAKPARFPNKLRSVRIQPLFLRKAEMAEILPQTHRVLRRSQPKMGARSDEEEFKYFYLKQKSQYERIFNKYGIKDPVDDSGIRKFVEGLDEAQKLRVI